MFEMKSSKNRGFLKHKLKDICFSTLKSYGFDKVEKNLSEAEYVAFKILIERKDLLIQKAEKIQWLLHLIIRRDKISPFR